MALAGYQEGSRSSLWRETSLNLYTRLTNPYLRAMFAFLTCDDDKYDNILVSHLLLLIKESAANLKQTVDFDEVFFSFRMKMVLVSLIKLRLPASIYLILP